MDTTVYLEDLERRIDPPVEDELLKAWRDFAAGRFRGDIFSPRRLRRSPPGVAWPVIDVNATQDDYEAMLISQLAGCSALLQSGAGAPLTVRSNYGTGIMPSLFGAELFMMPEEMNTLPTTRPMGGADAMKRLLDAGVPDLNGGLGAKTFEMGRRFAALGARYPKIGRYVHLYHPDLQGPMDIVELLWGSSLFLDLLDQPDLVHAVLDLITETYRQFMHAWERIVPPQGGYAAHWGLLHRGRIMLRDDSAMNLSPEMFDEFIRPYDARLLHEFGGGGIHFCGRGDHYIASACRIEGVFAINLTQPGCNQMEEIYRNTVDRGIPLLNLNRSAAEAAIAAGRDLHGQVHCP